MSIEELRSTIGDAVKQGGTFVRLVAPSFPKYAGFPRGELLCVNSEGDQVRLFSTWRLVKWLDELPVEDSAP